MREQFTKQLGNVGGDERDTDFLDSLSLGWSEQGLDFGDEIHNKTLGEMVKTYPDYTENQEQYDAFANSKEGSPRYDNVFKQNFFSLDNENNVQFGKGWYGKFGEGDWGNPKNLYDQNIIKGMLLSKRNGYTLEGYDSEYNRVGNEIATSYQQQMSEQSKTSEKIGHALGMMGRYIATPETIIEVMSPFKVKTGKTIAQSIYHSAKAELPYAFVGEAIRQKGIMTQKRRVSQEYTLWDATKEVLINAGFASALRGIGGGVVDGVTHAKVSKRIKNGKDKETWDRFVDMQNSQLVPNSKLHNELINKAEDDIEMGKNVDIAEHTEIDALAKADEGVEEINIFDELPKESPEVEMKLIKEVDEIQPIKESDNPYEGMATPEEADKLINDFADNPEIARELEEIRVMEDAIKSLREEVTTTPKGSLESVSKQEQMKEASTGGVSEDEMKQAVNNIMSEKDLDSQFKNMSKTEMDELDKEFIREEAEQLWAEADTVFAKGGDNIAAGLVAGIEEDENGNISFNPVNFIVGMGGYTAVKAMLKSPKVRDELKNYAQKALDSVEGNPMFDMRSNIAMDTNPLHVKKETTKVVDSTGNPLTVYHGTDKEFKDFDPDKSFDGGLWFTSDLKALKKGEVGAGGKGRIIEAKLDVKKMAGWEEYEKYSLAELRRDGYDGVKLDDDYIVFENSQVKQIKETK